jgi:copper(I)-binding protein
LRWNASAFFGNIAGGVAHNRAEESMMKTSGIVSGSVLFASALFATAAQAQDAKAGDFVTSGAWCRAVPSASDANCYVMIENKGAAPDRLVGASADVADKAEVRQINTSSGGLTDKPVAGGLPISAGDKVALAPGGYHLTLLNTKAALKKGAKQVINLEFEKAGKSAVSFDVLPASSKGPPAPKVDATMKKK